MHGSSQDNNLIGDDIEIVADITGSSSISICLNANLFALVTYRLLKLPLLGRPKRLLFVSAALLRPFDFTDRVFMMALLVNGGFQGKEFECSVLGVVPTRAAMGDPIRPILGQVVQELEQRRYFVSFSEYIC